MKRFILFYSFFTFCLLMVEANPISKAQALQEAKEFLSSKGIVMQTTDEAYKAPRKANSKDANPYYYIYNVGNDNGFVIVSGDDRTKKILGYVDSGNFDEDNVPAPLKEWLRGYEREIESLSTIELSSTSPKRKVIEKTKKAIPPMTTSKWGYGYPFNSATPIVNGKNTPPGCSPICFAQFLYYYRNQNVEATTAEIPSYTANNITLSNVPKGTILDWDNMLDEYTYNSGYTNEQMNAVSNLMLYVGKAMSSIYTSNGTLTSTAKFHPALINYFGFDPSIAYIDREYYSVDDWENVIYNELAHQRPVVYNAFSLETGHTLLVDGYDTSGLFHINWGWEGKCDGYFRLSILNRYQPGINTSISPNDTYMNKHSALLYAVPASMGCVNTSNYELNGKITSASNSTLSCKFHNQSGMEGYYQYGVGFVNENNEVVLIKKFNNAFAYLNNTNSATRYFNLSANDFQNADLDYGTYNVVPLFQYIDHEEWKVCQHESANYAIVNYSSYGISSSLHSNLQNISVSNFEFIGDGLINSEQIIKTTISNTSNDYSYSDILYCFASTTTTMGEAISSAIVNMNKSEDITINFPIIPSENGTYNIWISTDSYGDNIIGQTKMNITSRTIPSLDISNVDFIITKNFAVFQNGLRSIWGNTFSVNIIGIKNNSDYTIQKTILVWLREYDSITSPSWNYNPRFTTYRDNAISIPIDIVVPPQSDYTIPIVFDNLKLNTRYDIRVEYDDNSLIIGVLPMVFLPALTTWKSDGTSISVEPQETMEIDDDVIAVDITDATTIKTLNINSNPNVLYYMGESQTIPEGLSNANVIKGTYSENVTLRDSCDFFVPKTFTAKNISFTTTPSIGAISGSNVGWNTIALPFDVTSVKNTTDNKEIDWFHPNETVGKDFWVRGFERLDKDGDIIFVDNVEQMQAYEPYLYNVPSEYWGKKRNLCGKELTFYGENATLYKDVNAGVHSSAYNLIGTTVGKTVNNAWFINAEGDAFIYNESQDVPAFHAYFIDSNQHFSSLVSPKEKPTLRIKFHDDNNVTSIMAPLDTDTDQVDVFNLQGVKVATLSLNNGSIDIRQLPKGVYVVGGKKMIR